MAVYTYPNGGCACSRESCDGCTVTEFGREHAKIRKLMTNADCIRAMTNEELADWIYNATTNALSILQIGSDAPTQSYFGWFNWLKQEVEDDRQY